MKKCNDCQLSTVDCICSEVEQFFQDSKDTIKFNQSEKNQEKQCLACFFAPCRCREGLANK